MSGRLENDSFKILDTVVSMNGFHAFPDKQKAFHEIWRVLKPGGDFIACFYIRGKSKRTDWLVKKIVIRKLTLYKFFYKERHVVMVRYL